MMRLQCIQLGKVFSAAMFLAAMLIVTVSHAAFIDLTPTNGSNSNSSVKLSDLVNPSESGVDGIVVGDKTMSGFVYSPIGDMPAATNVNVLGFKDQSGNWGLSFHGTFVDLPGGGASDALIRFQVDVSPEALARGWRINDAHLFLNGVGVGSPDSGFFVDESFAEISNQTLNTHVSTFPNGDSKLSDSEIFNTPLTTLHVTKDILAIAASDSGQPSRATAIDQSFSQYQIPEPTSLLLSLVGLIGLAAYRRSR